MVGTPLNRYLRKFLKYVTIMWDGKTLIEIDGTTFTTVGPDGMKNQSLHLRLLVCTRKHE